MKVESPKQITNVGLTSGNHDQRKQHLTIKFIWENSIDSVWVYLSTPMGYDGGIEITRKHFDRGMFLLTNLMDEDVNVKHEKLGSQ